MWRDGEGKMQQTGNRYNEKQLPLSMLLAFSVISIPLSAVILPVFIYVPTFYAQDVGVSLSLIGILVFLARLWDGITDPTIGLLSDRVQTRFGRRKPWLAAGAVMTSLGSYFLFKPPTGAGGVHLTVTMFAMYLGWTMMSIPHGAWGAELTRHYDQRSRLVGVNMAADTLGFFVIGLVPIVLGLEGEDFSGALLSAIALPVAMSVLIVVVIPLTLVPRGYNDADPITKSPLPKAAIFRDVLANKPFLRLCGGMVGARIGEGIRTTLAVLFVTYYWGRSDIMGYAIFLVTIGTLVSIPLWLWASKRFEKATSWRVPLLLSILSAPIVLFIDPGFTPGILALFLFSGVLTGGATILPQAMLGDVVDFDSLKSKKLRAGTYLSIWSFSVKLVYAVPVLIIFPLLDAAGFDAKLGADNSPASISLLGYVYAFLPIPFSIGALVSIWGYPLNRQKHGVIQRRLEALNIGVR
ncbi:MAG: MFS transporter [Pseudomonadota bacterium]